MRWTCRSRPVSLPGRSRSWRSTSCPTRRGRCWRCAASRAPAGCSPPRSGIFAAVSSISACSGTPLRQSTHRPRLARDRLFSHPLAQPEGLASLWQASGLRNIKGSSLTIRMDYASFADYWKPLLGGQGPFGSYVAGLPDKRRAIVRAAVRDAYLFRRAGRPALAGRHRLGRARARAVALASAGAGRVTARYAEHTRCFRHLRPTPPRAHAARA